MARHQQTHLSGWPALLLAPLVIPVILGVLVLQKLSILKSTADLTAGDVAGYLEDFIEDRSGPWDWDDFTSIPITDPHLEAIRVEVSNIPLPLDDRGEARFRELLDGLRREP